MKRVLSILLAAVLLLTMMPFAAFADESEASVHDELIAQACEVFPEYAEIIRGSGEMISPFVTYSTGNVVVYSETRSISDNHSMTISQYSDGAVAISDLSGFTSTLTDFDSVGYTTRDVITASFKVTMSGASGYFCLNNFKCSIFHSDYDRIDSVGTISCSGATYNSSAITKNLRETATSYARYTIPVSFIEYGEYYPISFGVSVGNNKMHYGTY